MRPRPHPPTPGAAMRPHRARAVPDPAARCRARSASYQLLSIAFAHPVPEITAQLEDGRFQSAFAGHMETAFGRIPALPLLALDPSDFGSAYIALFERGTRGRPPVPLCAGEYMQLLDGRPRPEVLLDHVRFYRHFGLKVRGHGEDNELPDHLCCQLEAMAWLGELEARARRAHGPGDGIERAQADFLDKLLIPFLERFVPTLDLEISSRGGDPLFAALGEAAASLATWHAHALGAALPAPPAPAHEPLTEEQNLWG